MISIHDLKQQINIVDVVMSYTELRKVGSNFQAMQNPLRYDKNPNFIVSPEKQIYTDFAPGDSGDVIDFIRAVENLTVGEAITFLDENYLGTHSKPGHTKLFQCRPQPVSNKGEQSLEEENRLISNLERSAEQYLAAHPGKKWNTFTLETVKANNDTDCKDVIRIAPVFEKLFEDYLIPTDEKFAKYLFERIIGFDQYFNCPMIIVRNEFERVVDLVRYRPERDAIPLKQKYLVAKNTIKPHKRGRNFVFPLQQQMIKMAHKEGYCFVGEGLKNAINASLAGVPFISIESTSSIDNKLIDFLKSPRMKDIIFIGALDGDQAGETAYNIIVDKIQLSKNIFDFNSGEDFSDYLKKLRRRILNDCQ